MVFLAEPSTSPSRAALVKEIKKAFPKASWTEYTPVDLSTSEQAAQAVFGKTVRSLPQLAKAKRVLSLDADFLSAADGHTAFTRDFAKSRKVKDSKDAKKMSRLYSVESTLTATGAAADHRLRLSSTQIGAFAALIGAEILKQKNAGGAAIAQLEKAGASLSVDSKWIEECAADLVQNAGKSLVLAGEHLPKSVHAIVFAINDALNAPVKYVEVASAATGIDAAAERLNKGDVKTLVVLGGNPAYDAPVDLDWAATQAKAETSIYLATPPTKPPQFPACSLPVRTT